MAYKVFISYSTKNIHIAEWAIRSLSRPGVIEVFVAEYSIQPALFLEERILAAIKRCDLFILLWSQEARQSDWVPQEIGVATGEDKPIVPIVLEANAPVPGFISGVKYLRAFENWEGSFVTLKRFVEDQAIQSAQRQSAVAVLAMLLGAVVLFSWVDD